MLERLRNSLIRSAAGRNLAIDLTEVHGDQAADVLDDMLNVRLLDPENRRVLMKAQEIMASITKRYPPTDLADPIPKRRVMRSQTSNDRNRTDRS